MQVTKNKVSKYILVQLFFAGEGGGISTHGIKSNMVAKCGMNPMPGMPFDIRS